MDGTAIDFIIGRPSLLLLDCPDVFQKKKMRCSTRSPERRYERTSLFDNMSNQEIIDNMLADMRNHVSSLHNKLSVADAAVNRCQTVNDKIVIMKEYEDRVSTINSCWRSKNRKGLVANLQHENRRMQALEEENRRLRFVLKEMEDGVHLIMADYRRVIAGFMRSETLLEFEQQHLDKLFYLENPERCIDHEKFMILSGIIDQCISIADERIAEQAGIIAELRTENSTLRELAYFKPMLRRNSAETVGTNAATATADQNMDKMAGDGAASDSVATTPVKTFQTHGVGKKPASGCGSQISINGAKGLAPDKELSTDTAATTSAQQYSWPVHVNRDLLKASKNSGRKPSTDDNGQGGGRMLPAATVTKAPLPRENPARRGSAMLMKSRAVGSAEKPVSAVQIDDGAASFTPPILVADDEDTLNPDVVWTTVSSADGNDVDDDHPTDKSKTVSDKPPPSNARNESSDTIDTLPSDALLEH